MNTRTAMLIRASWMVMCLCLPIGSTSANELPPASNKQTSTQELALSPAHAQTEALTKEQLANIETLYRQPAEAEALGTLSQQLNLQLDTRGQFIQLRHLQVLKKPLLSQGQFIFSPAQGLVWQQQRPFNTLMVLKDQQLIQQNSQGKVQQLNAAASGSPIAQQLPRLLQAIMAGDIDGLSADFNLFMPATQQAGAPWQLGLQAKDPQVQASIGNITLSGDSQLRSLMMTSSQADNSDYTQIQFIDVQQGPLSASELALFNISNESAQ
ncbi:outer membrane lipoprotein carrier protein LolA [Shewanella livingstonensis]|uniref:Outer membrane lipoprotein carrier protein LolA n=1 Tax=Shewanella livingstonensis TaxID=150120 RepID=A0A3G8M1U9_9GAMM|nr:outer membrane lipoprotein carrier protein LolA [Shewanella livingstonensis]AZG74970.1 outer membrane lipoprotein carrier protein LolA [Shewanella livingstonensis]